jgi:hypothetical protein
VPLGFQNPSTHCTTYTVLKMGPQVKQVKCVVCFHEVRSVIIVQRHFQSTNINLSIWRSKNPHATIRHIRASPKLNVLCAKNMIFRLFFHWWINYGWYLPRHVGTVHPVHFSTFRQFSSLLPIYSHKQNSRNTSH